jgi:hypothetical protein
LAFINIACEAATETRSKPLPGYPSDSQLLFAKRGQTIATGKAWLTDTLMGHPSYHMNGPSKVVFDLADLQLKSGFYRVGMIARTGTHWQKPTNQIQQYRLQLITSENKTIDLGTPQAMDAKLYARVMDSGEKNSWANWFGCVTVPNMAHLSGKEKLVVENLNSHGGVVAVWVEPQSETSATQIKVRADVAHNAFSLGQKPTLMIELDHPEGVPDSNVFVRLERFDLITRKTDVTTLPVKLITGQTQTIEHHYPKIPGLYRVRTMLMNTPNAQVSDKTTAIETLYAYTPAKWARDLPDDWPLAAHVQGNIPPLPGFKHFRFFSHWSRNNPAPGVYKWDEFDHVYNGVKAIGGKLMIAYDGSPIWTCSRGKSGMGWISGATAYPPDEMQSLENYIAAMIQRYQDPQGTIDSLELCNEPNTISRWNGTPEQYTQTAIAYRRGIDRAEPSQPIKIIGMAISAGDHRGAVKQFVQADLLDHVDAVSAHWYEEIMSYEAKTPINNLLKHVDMLMSPMQQAGKVLPMINSECGIHFSPRENGQIVDQQTINQRDEADPDWNKKEKWLIGNKWRRVSEYRAAAGYVTGTVMLLHEKVMPNYYFSHFDFFVDGVPSLPWVALGQLGHHLDGVDYHTVKQLEAHVVGCDEKDGSPKALAYLLGKPGKKQIIVAWGYISDTSIGRSKHWQRWLEPVDIQINTDIKQATCSDLYGRKSTSVNSTNGKLTITCGEEPAFITVK